MNGFRTFCLPPFLLITLVVCVIAPNGASAADALRAVVYEWDPASFHPSPPYQVATVKRSSGARAQGIAATGAGWNNYICVPQGRLKGGQEYTALLKYEIITSTSFPDTFYMFARSKSLGQHHDIWQTWVGDAHASGIAKLPMRLQAADDWMFFVGCKGPGVQVIDSFQIVEGTGFAYLPAGEGARFGRSTFHSTGSDRCGGNHDRPAGCTHGGCPVRDRLRPGCGQSFGAGNDRRVGVELRRREAGHQRLPGARRRAPGLSQGDLPIPFQRSHPVQQIERPGDRRAGLGIHLPEAPPECRNHHGDGLHPLRDQEPPPGLGLVGHAAGQSLPGDRRHGGWTALRSGFPRP